MFNLIKKRPIPLKPKIGHSRILHMIMHTNLKRTHVQVLLDYIVAIPILNYVLI
jgi:hypothetical protein